MKYQVKRSRTIITGTFILIFMASCASVPPPMDLNFRQEMRDFVIRISDTAHDTNPSFIVVPQNGQELISLSDRFDGPLAEAYVKAIGGTGREDLFYGYTRDNVSTPVSENEYMMRYLDRFEAEGKEVLSIDYCFTTDKMDNSYRENEKKGFISFAADERNLTSIPSYPSFPFNVNSNNITSLSEAANFLFLINSEKFDSTQSFVDAVKLTNYDIVIMDLFHNEDEYTYSQINELKTKANGGSRLVICYMSIGEAENYRFYWNYSWHKGNPIWLDRENPHWPGNFKVRYWEKEWQDIILKGDKSYLGRILAAGFDGVYLDIIDGFWYFENR